MFRPDTFALTALLALLTAFGPVSTDMYLPSLPAIGRLLSASAAEVQLTLSAYLVGFAVGQIFYGPAADRYGRKPVLLFALAIYCAASLVCAAAPTIEVLILSRTLQALGASGAIVIARAIVRDLYTGPRAGRELSLMGSIMALAPMVAPLAGSLLHTAFGWRINFVAAFAVGLVAVGLVWRKLPETLPVRAAEPFSAAGMLRSFRTIGAHPAFLAYLGIVSLTYAGLFAWISGSSFVLQDLYGLTPFQFGLTFTSCGIGFFVGAMIAARLVTRLGLNRTIGLGAFALAAGGLAMVATLLSESKSVVLLIVPMMLYLAGLGLAMPQSMAGALMPFPDRAGAASSLMGFIQQTCSALLGALVGQMLGASAWPMAIPIAAAGCLTLVLWALSRNVRARTDLAHRT